MKLTGLPMSLKYDSRLFALGTPDYVCSNYWWRKTYNYSPRMFSIITIGGNRNAMGDDNYVY